MEISGFQNFRISEFDFVDSNRRFADPKIFEFLKIEILTSRNS